VTECFFSWNEECEFVGGAICGLYARALQPKCQGNAQDTREQHKIRGGQDRSSPDAHLLSIGRRWFALLVLLCYKQNNLM
jgi:hypothetical protein